ncbi:hypothetical protein TcBrA4_0074890 [Trypanosoma cruzi]|nr:hypothetical protein TcBrA4_0074890 [Trypanosoma cruzi]
MRVDPANGGCVSVLLGNTAGRTRRHHLAAGKEGTHTTHTEVVDATIPVHVGNGRTRVHRREAGTPSHSMAHDSHQITEIRRRGGTGVRPLGQASDGVEDIPFVILLPHQNGTAEYGLVGLVATNAPNHVVAYIPSALRKDTEWVMIDGMVQKVQRKPLNTHKVSSASTGALGRRRDRRKMRRTMSKNRRRVTGSRTAAR